MGKILSGNRALSTEKLTENAARAATGFHALGIGRGQAVALCLRNDFAFFEASLGLGRIGAYPVPVNWHGSVEEVRYLLQDSGADVVVIHADLLVRFAAAVPASLKLLVVPTPSEIAAAYAVTPEACGAAAGSLVWDEWLSRHSPHAEAPVEAPGTIIYTSGTTGRPKGVKRQQPTRAQAAAALDVRMRVFGFKDRPVADIITVVTGPMYHSSPNAYALLAARLGATVILQPRFDAEDLLRTISEQRVTHIHMVPIMFNRLLKLSKATRDRYDVSSLSYIIHGAAPIPSDIKRAMIDWWGPIIHEYYGGTETSLAVFCHAQDWLRHPGSVGRPLPETDLAVLGPDGKKLPAGEIGEIACRLRSFADFTYHGDDEKRRRADRGGLISLGDVGYLDEEGFVYLCDRAADMVISGGVNIYPAEIEAEIQRIGGVADCAVFGIPDDEYGESLVAVIEPQQGASLDAESIRAHLRHRLAAFKVPKQIELRFGLPREDSGKIFKRRLREPYWEGRERRI